MRQRVILVVIIFLTLSMELYACGSQQHESTNSSLTQQESIKQSNDNDYDEYDEDEDNWDIVEIQDLDLDTILSDPELTEQYFDIVDITELDEETILSYDVLLERYRDTQDFDAGKVEMESTPNSSCFSAVGYSPIWNNMVVTFRESEAMYVYYDVPEDEWSSFISADSLGGYYNSYIKGFYDCDRWN